MSFNDENVKFLKHLSCELKVAQNGSVKWNSLIFSKFPVLQTGLDKHTFIQKKPLCLQLLLVCKDSLAQNLNCHPHTL